MRPDWVSASVTARAAGERVEVLSERSETTRVWVRPDGVVDEEVAAAPVRFEDSSAVDGWTEMDPSLVVRDGRLVAAALPQVVSVGSGSEPVVRFGSDVALSLPGVTLPAPSVEGSTATFADVVPGVDARLEVRTGGFEFLWVVRSAAGAAELVERFGSSGRVVLPILVQAAGGVPAAADGSMGVLDARGTRVGVFGSPTMWDSNAPVAGERGVQKKVSFTVGAVKRSGRVQQAAVSVGSDAVWLTSAAREFPVYIDPTYAATNTTAVFDTYVQSNVSSDQSLSTELRVGTYGDGVVARSFINFSAAAFKGKSIVSGSLSLWESWSWSCSARPFLVYDTPVLASASTRWSNQPGANALRGTTSVAKGYSSSCPGGRVDTDITSVVKNWSGTSASQVGVTLRAGNESDVYGWKKFLSAEGAAKPLIKYSYNRAPNTPSAPSVASATWMNSWWYVGTPTPTLSSVGTDPDGNQIAMRFAKFTSASSTANPVTVCSTGYQASGSTFRCTTMASAAFPENASVWIRTATKDQASSVYGAWSSPTRVMSASKTPPTPTIACPTANGSWQDAVKPAETCTVTLTAKSGEGASGPVKVKISRNMGGYVSTSITQAQPGAPVTVQVTGHGGTNGAHSIRAIAVSPTGKESAVGFYGFGYGAPTLNSPTSVMTSTGAVRIDAAGAPSNAATSVTGTVQWRIQGSGDHQWVDAPASNTLSTRQEAGSTTVKGRLDLSSLVDQADGSGVKVAKRTSTVIDVRVCMEYSGAGTSCTGSQAVVRVPHAFGSGFPVADAGPGQRALWTGEFQVSDTDAELDAPGGGISVSRVHSSFAGEPAVQNGVFGPGWVASFEGGPVGVSGAEVIDSTRADGTVVVMDADGEVLVFAAPVRRTGASLAAGGYTPVTTDTVDSGMTLVVSGTGASTEVTVTDEDGVVTRFTAKTAPAAGQDAVFAAADVTDTVTTGKATYSYDAQGRVVAIVGPLPDGIGSCTPGTPANGCRVLRIAYATSTTATGSTPGDYTGRVKQITADVNTQTGIVLADYSYDVKGRLVTATDTRTGLSTGYGWTGPDAQPRLASITPPGQATFTFEYQDEKLSKVTRPVPGSAGGGTAQLAAFVDNIPLTDITGLGGLDEGKLVQFAGYDLTRAATTGFAVFGPDTPIGQAPAAGDDAWRKADVQLTDAEGYTIHTASYGAGAWQFTANEYDAYDNVIRAWDTRATGAIRDGSVVDIDSAATQTVYNEAIMGTDGTTVTPAGTLVTDVYSPAARVVGPDGAEVSLRRHVKTFYDEGAPNAGINPATSVPFRLTTRTVTTGETVAKEIVETIGTTITGYEPVVSGDTSGWTLGQATTVTTDMNGNGQKDAADITSVTRYDEQGRVVEERQPSSSGSDAGTRRTVYYTAGANTVAAECGHKPEWAGYTCKVGPIGQPAGVTMPVTVTTGYRWDGQATTSTETSGGVTRMETTGFDGRDRPATVTTTVTGLDGSTSVAPVTTGYDDATGQVTGTTSAAGSTGFGYDAWGRQVTYSSRPAGQDTADVTTTTYNPLGQVVQVTDPNGTTGYTWDGTDANGNTETRNLTTAVTITVGDRSWTSTGAYDAHGTLVRENLPGGIVKRLAYDVNGELVEVAYNGQVTDPDTSVVAQDQPWIAWSLLPNTAGQTAHEWTPDGAAFTGDLPGTTAIASDRHYGYDKAGRLATVTDQTGTQDSDTTCTLRSYGFDQNGNRTGQGTATAAPNTACPVTATTALTRAYDAADRPVSGANGTGVYSYDPLGRQLSIPAMDAPRPGDGDITLAYHDTDSIRSITQNNQTLTWGLDGAGRRYSQHTNIDGANVTTLWNHYTDTGDNPTWSVDRRDGTDTTTRWGELIDGDLGLTITDGTTAELALADPHDSVATTVTLPDTGSATGLDRWNSFDEYGNTTSPITGDAAGVTSQGYGWLGTKQRTTTTTGLILMGARVYNPTTGLFTSTDPEYNGGDTTYGYPNDPVNNTDITGRSWWSKLGKWAKRNRGTIATVASIAVCAAVGLIGCGIATAFAFAVRTQQTVSEKGGWKKNRGAIIGDAIMTTTTFGIGGVFRYAKYGRSMFSKGAKTYTRSYADFVGARARRAVVKRFPKIMPSFRSVRGGYVKRAVTSTFMSSASGVSLLGPYAYRRQRRGLR